MVIARPPDVDCAGFEQGSDVAKGRRVIGVATPINRYGSTSGCIEPDNHPHGCRLARSVRAEEACHHTGMDCEAQVRDRYRVAVAFGQSVGLDHVCRSLPISVSWIVVGRLSPPSAIAT